MESLLENSGKFEELKVAVMRRDGKMIMTYGKS